MRKTIAVTLLSCALGAFTVVSYAEDEDEVPFESEIEARQAFMNVYRFNLGILGGMARGKTPYDADRASAAAGNLLLAAQMKNGAMWPRGSDASVEGLAGVTRAKAEIWGEDSEVGARSQDLREALTVMSAEAGNGLDALRANMRSVGDGCKGCHDSYRVPED